MRDKPVWRMVRQVHRRHTMSSQSLPPARHPFCERVNQVLRVLRYIRRKFAAGLVQRPGCLLAFFGAVADSALRVFRDHVDGTLEKRKLHVLALRASLEIGASDALHAVVTTVLCVFPK